MTPTMRQQPSTAQSGPSEPPASHRIRSHDILQGQRRVVIEHGEASYTLLLTRNDKLILVK
jgi:hemin uptake protein HemP